MNKIWVSEFLKPLHSVFTLHIVPSFFSGKKEIHKKELEISTLAAKIFIYNNWKVVEVLRYNTESSREWIKGLLGVFKKVWFFFFKLLYLWMSESQCHDVYLKIFHLHFLWVFFYNCPYWASSRRDTAVISCVTHAFSLPLVLINMKRLKLFPVHAIQSYEAQKF